MTDDQQAALEAYIAVTRSLIALYTEMAASPWPLLPDTTLRRKIDAAQQRLRDAEADLDHLRETYERSRYDPATD